MSTILIRRSRLTVATSLFWIVGILSVTISTGVLVTRVHAATTCSNNRCLTVAAGAACAPDYTPYAGGTTPGARNACTTAPPNCSTTTTPPCETCVGTNTGTTAIKMCVYSQGGTCTGNATPAGVACGQVYAGDCKRDKNGTTNQWGQAWCHCLKGNGAATGACTYIGGC